VEAFVVEQSRGFASKSCNICSLEPFSAESRCEIGKQYIKHINSNIMGSSHVGTDHAKHYVHAGIAFTNDSPWHGLAMLGRLWNFQEHD
jgi:hypothetical protein